jgi:O-antigen ligase
MAVLPDRPFSASTPLRSLRWAPPLIALLVFAQIVAGGANDGMASALAACADALVALAVLALSPTASGFWRFARWPIALLAVALVWGALPAILPHAMAQALGVPANPAADMVGLAFDKALTTSLLLIVAALLSYRTGSARDLVRWLTLVGMIYSVYAAVDAIDWLTDSARAARYGGTIGNPNAAGIGFAAIALLAGGLVLAPDTEHMLLRLAALAGSAVALVLCALTGSRSAILLAVLFGVLLLVRRWRRWQDGRPPLRLVAPAALALVMLMGVVAILTPVANRSAYLPEDAGSRWAVVEHFTMIANEHSVWGHGLGSFFEVNQRTLTADTAPLYWNFGAAHNAPVQVALETGWPGLILLGLALATIAVQVLAARRDWWSIAPLCATGAIGGSAMVDIALNVPALAAFAAILSGAVWGAALANGSARRRTQPQRQPHRHRRTAEDRNEPVVEATI